MATLKIDEFSSLRTDSDGRIVPVADYSKIVATQTVTFTTATDSAAFSAGTQIIRVIADAKAHYAIGSAPTATANSSYLAADTSEYFGVKAGHKISSYDGTS